MAFITDLVKAPLSGEIAANILSRWNDFLFQQINLVQPKAVVLLGTTPLPRCADHQIIGRGLPSPAIRGRNEREPTSLSLVVQRPG